MDVLTACTRLEEVITTSCNPNIYLKLLVSNAAAGSILSKSNEISLAVRGTLPPSVLPIPAVRHCRLVKTSTMCKQRPVPASSFQKPLTRTLALMSES
jgi:hypothetical protein